jgi:hypothetical protein
MRLGAIALLALLAVPPGAAESLDSAFIAEHRDAIVSRVVYEGNRRTRDSAIAELTEIRAGMRLSDIDPESAKQNVLKSNIFSSVDLAAEIEDGAVVVTVAVKEKWTLIPIPSAYFGSDGWSAGLDVLEYNFLGLRKTLVVGGADSNLGLSGLLAYSDPRFLHSRTSFRLFAQAGSAVEEAEFMDGTTYASFQETTAAGGLSLVYPSEEKLTGEFDLYLRYFGVGQADASKYGLYQDSLALVPSAVVNYDGQLNVGYRNAGAIASVSYLHGFRLRGMPSYDAVEANVEMDFKVFLEGYLEAGAVGRYGNWAFQSLGSLSGPGYRTLPYQYSFSPTNAAAYANLAIPFVRAGWSAMEIGPFYECGFYETGLDASTMDLFQGPGLLYRLYLRDIALPVVEISAAYNVPARNPVVSLNVGVTL